MDLEVIRNLCEKRDGGLKKLASDIGMSEANLHRCIKNNKIQAADLEAIAIKLDVDIRTFFDAEAIKYASPSTPEGDSQSQLHNRELFELCKSLIANYQQRDDVMSKLVSMVKVMGG